MSVELDQELEMLDDAIGVEEVSPEVEQVDGQAEVAEQVEEPVDWRSDEVRGIAQELGWNDATLEEMGSPKAFRAAVSAYARAMQHTNQQAGGERQPAGQEGQSLESVSPVFAELDLSDLEADDPVRQKLEQFQKGVKEAFEAQQKAVDSLLYASKSAEQQRYEQEWNARFDLLDTTLSDVNPDLFGKGRIQEVGESQQHLRRQVAQDFAQLRLALPNRSDAELIQMALAGKSDFQKQTKAPDPKIRERAASIQGGKSVGANPPGRAEAYRKLNERMLASLADEG